MKLDSEQMHECVHAKSINGKDHSSVDSNSRETPYYRQQMSLDSCPVCVSETCKRRCPEVESSPGGRSTEDWEVSEGGWGWVCVIAISMVSLLQRGTSSIFTLVYQQLRIKFDSSAAETGWVYSVYVMFNMCFSPVFAALLKRFSCRKVAFCGAIIYSLAIIASAFPSSLAQLYVVFAIAGLGSGMVSTTGPVILNYYFAKKRSLATAMSLITNGLGGAIYAPLISYLFGYYGYTGTMMITGALLLHMAAATLVYATPRKVKTTNQPTVGEMEEDMGMADINEKVKTTGQPIAREMEEDMGLADISEKVKTTGEPIAGEREEDMGLADISEKVKTTGQPIAGEREEDMGLADISEKVKTIGQPIAREREEEMRLTDISEKDEECVKNVDVVKTKTPKMYLKRASQLFIQHINVTILRRRSFALYCFMMWSYSFAMSGNSVMIAPFFADRHMTKYQIAALLSVYSGVSIPARLVIGFTCDRPRARTYRMLIYGVSISIMGVILMIGPLTYNFASLCAWYVTFGVLGSISSSQESVIIADLVGAKQLPDGVGISKFFRGFGVLMGPTIGGLLADRTGNYNYTYLTAGMLLMLSSFTFWIHLLIERFPKATLCTKSETLALK